MTTELIAIIMASVALGSLILRQSAHQDKRISDLIERLDSRMNRLDKRIDDQGKHMDTRLDKLDERINDQGKHMDTRLDKLGERISGLATELAALKATVETFFRVRIDPPPPNPEHHDQAA